MKTNFKNRFLVGMFALGLTVGGCSSSQHKNDQNAANTNMDRAGNTIPENVEREGTSAAADETAAMPEKPTAANTTMEKDSLTYPEFNTYQEYDSARTTSSSAHLGSGSSGMGR